MTYANYRQMQDAIRECKPFRGNSARGEFDTIDGVYRVYSYNTLIATITPYTMAHYTINARKYSSTTSRLQNIIRRAWQGIKFTETEYGN
jgi:hypothetical protein